MGKLTWLGWQGKVEGAPQPTAVIYGSKLRVEDSSKASASEEHPTETDFVLALLRRANLPLTRENYLGLAYPDGVPDDLDETSLPPELRQ